jgi:hypothetical protein
VPKALQVITTGDTLWSMINGVRSFHPAWPSNISAKHQDLIDAFFDEVDGWMNVAGILILLERGERLPALSASMSKRSLKQAFLLEGGCVTCY